MQNDKPLSAKKLIAWMENSPNAAGFWEGLKSLESFDALNDAIDKGEFGLDLKGEEK